MKLYPCDKSETVFHLVFLCCNDQESFQNGLLSRSLSKKKKSAIYRTPEHLCWVCYHSAEKTERRALSQHSLPLR